MTRWRLTRKTVLLLAALGVAALLIGLVASAVMAKKAPPAGPVQLPGNKIPQFVDALPDLYMITDNGSQIVLQMKEFQSQVMPSTWAAKNPAYTGTWVWGYLKQGQVVGPTTSYIGPVVVATRGNATEIKYVNMLGLSAGSNLNFWKNTVAAGGAVDQTLHWANPGNIDIVDGNQALYSGPVPAVPHLHGGEVPPAIDGGPDAWFYDPSLTPTGYSSQGHAYYTKGNLANTVGSAVYRYPNTQEAAPLWFHDHLLGATRLNVYAGLAGAYLLKDPANERTDLQPLPLVPLVIQDRMFDTNGQLFFPNVGINPEHPYWVPEFVGDTIVVNGKVWPFKVVNRQRYSFLFLNGSNARAYDMYLQDQTTGIKGPPMWVTGTDGGYLDTPVKIDPNVPKKAGQQSLVMMPGERYTVIVDFNDPTWVASVTAAYAAMGQTVPNTLNLTLRNTARTPFPAGAAAVQSTTGRIMQFRVNWLATSNAGYNPDPAQGGGGTLRPNNPIQRLVNQLTGALNVTPDVTRSLTLNEVMGAGGPLAVLVNNTLWDGLTANQTVRLDFTPIISNGQAYYYSELPQEGQTEIWEIINLTADAHPIHLHLVQFQLQSRQAFDALAYNAVYNAAFPGGGIGPYPLGVYMPGYGPPKAYDFYATAGNIPARGPIYGGNPDVTASLLGLPIAPLPSEAGWKDTVIMYPGQVTRIAVRWAPTDLPTTTPSTGAYFPFDPNGGHGYVWHCHIIDHEDNEMMRPTSVYSNPSAVRTYIFGVDY